MCSTLFWSKDILLVCVWKSYLLLVLCSWISQFCLRSPLYFFKKHRTSKTYIEVTLRILFSLNLSAGLIFFFISVINLITFFWHSVEIWLILSNSMYVFCHRSNDKGPQWLGCEAEWWRCPYRGSDEIQCFCFRTPEVSIYTSDIHSRIIYYNILHAFSHFPSVNVAWFNNTSNIRWRLKIIKIIIM